MRRLPRQDSIALLKHQPGTKHLQVHTYNLPNMRDSYHPSQRASVRRRDVEVYICLEHHLFKIFIYYYFMCMGTLPGCLDVYHMCAMHNEARREYRMP